MIADGTIKRIAEEYSVFQSDVARFESAIREALQEYAASGWVDVRERMPELMHPVLVFAKGCDPWIDWTDTFAEGLEWCGEGAEIPTHWKEIGPLPHAPAGTGEEAERG